jgi:hypothetical protein
MRLTSLIAFQYTIRHDPKSLDPVAIDKRPFKPAERSENPASIDTDRKASGVVAGKDEKKLSVALAILAQPTRSGKNLRQTEPSLIHFPFESPPPYHYSAVLLCNGPMTAAAHAVYAINAID